MTGGTDPEVTADGDPRAPDGGVGPGGNPGVSVPAEALVVGEGPAELPRDESTSPEEASSAQRRLLAELGVSEDELAKLVHNAEFVVGVKRLNVAADAGPSASVTDNPMVVEDPAVEVAQIQVRAPVAAEVEGVPLDSDGGRFRRMPRLRRVAGVEENLANYEESG